MLSDLFSPRYRRRYSELTMPGPMLDGFPKFLTDQGYPLAVVRRRVRVTRYLERRLKKRGCRKFLEVTPTLLRACMPPKGRAHECPEISATAKLLEKYFIFEGLFQAAQLGKIDHKLIVYREYLQSVRGLASSTTVSHLVTVRKFLNHVCPDGDLRILKRLSAQDIEDFVKNSGDRVGRGFLQHIVARVRSFLRYLASRSEAPAGLDAQIDTSGQLERPTDGVSLPRKISD